MKKYDAVIAGYFCMDMVPKFQKKQEETNISRFLEPGKLIEIDGLDFSAGGVVANTGAAMKKFGSKVFLNGLIGEDLLGKIARDWFEKLNLSEGIQITTKAGTAFSIVLAPPEIDRLFWNHPDVIRYSIQVLSISRQFPKVDCSISDILPY
jgi:Sugar kinases, ribokinase family